jgi:hypothetical protein
MRIGGRAIAGTIAFVVLIASLAGLWRVLIDDPEMRLTGEALSGWARSHPPKPWRGFDIAIMDVSVDREVHIKAHVSGHMIHTPVEISGTPEFDAEARAVFFHVMTAKLPRDTARPMLSRFYAMLNPLASYIAQNVTDFIPAKKIKGDTQKGALLLTTVKAVRVDGDVVVVEFHRHRVAAATAVLVLSAVLSAVFLFATALRAKPSRA